MTKKKCGEGYVSVGGECKKVVVTNPTITTFFVLLAGLAILQSILLILYVAIPQGINFTSYSQFWCPFILALYGIVTLAYVFLDKVSWYYIWMASSITLGILGILTTFSYPIGLDWPTSVHLTELIVGWLSVVIGIIFVYGKCDKKSCWY